MRRKGDAAPLVEGVVPGVWRIEAAVPTLPPFESVNTYVVADAGVAIVVDPGSDAADAARSIASVLERAAASPKGIVLTHTHRDHLGGVGRLLERWPDAAVYVHPRELARTDASWRAKPFAGGRRLTVGNELVEALDTPGHSPGHLALWLEGPRLLLAGDLVAGHGSVWVGAPDGDVGAYLDSLERAAALGPGAIGPGHGPLRRDGASALRDARQHRRMRERAVLTALAGGPRHLGEIRAAIYGPQATDVADFAERSILAHLRKLMQERRVMHVGSDERGPFDLAPGAGPD